MMSISKLGIAAIGLSLLCMSSLPVAEAAGRAGAGKGQMLRDGSCNNGSRAASAGARLQQQGGRPEFQRPQQGIQGLGNGTQPRPQDGTGFGYGPRR